MEELGFDKKNRPIFPGATVKLKVPVEKGRRRLKYIGAGIFELRLDFGPGYRIYYAYMGKEIILLLAGGGKKSQARDIKKAKQRWQEYKQLIK